MIKKFLLAAVAMATLGTAVPAAAQQSDRRERDSRYEQRHDRGEARRGRPDRDQIRYPGRYNNGGRRYNNRHYRGRYYNNGHYFQHRYRHHGGWRYR